MINLSGLSKTIFRWDSLRGLNSHIMKDMKRIAQSAREKFGDFDFRHRAGKLAGSAQSLESLKAITFDSNSPGDFCVWIKGE